MQEHCQDDLRDVGLEEVVPDVMDRGDEVDHRELREVGRCDGEAFLRLSPRDAMRSDDKVEAWFLLACLWGVLSRTFVSLRI